MTATGRCDCARPTCGVRSVPACTPPFDGGDHVVGFVRGGAVLTLVTRAPVRLAAAGGWRDLSVTLPRGEWTDVLTGRHDAADLAECSEPVRDPAGGTAGSGG